jgi:hypothetical protein
MNRIDNPETYATALTDLVKAIERLCLENERAKTILRNHWPDTDKNTWRSIIIDHYATDQEKEYLAERFLSVHDAIRQGRQEPVVLELVVSAIHKTTPASKRKCRALGPGGKYETKETWGKTMQSDQALEDRVEDLPATMAKVRRELEMTRIAVISLKATIASLDAKASGTSVQDAYETLRHREESLSRDIDASDEILAIRSLLMSLTARFPEKRL